MRESCVATGYPGITEHPHTPRVPSTARPRPVSAGTFVARRRSHPYGETLAITVGVRRPVRSRTRPVGRGLEQPPTRGTRRLRGRLRCPGDHRVRGCDGTFFVLAPPLTTNPWTIVTSVYAHSGLGHLVSNALALLVFGWPVARATTRWRFHAFFAITGAIAGVSQVALTGVFASMPFVPVAPTAVLGASGAVFALLGYLVASNRLSTGLASFIEVPQCSRSSSFSGSRPRSPSRLPRPASR